MIVIVSSYRVLVGGIWCAAVDNQNKKGQGQQKMNASQMVRKVNFVYLIVSSWL